MKPIPSLAAIYSKLESDLKTKLNLSDADLKFVVNAMAGVVAAQLKLCYLYLQDNQNEQFPDTADTAENGGTLERQGMIFLGREPFPATDGIYTATVAGVNGAVIRADLTFKSSGDSNSPGNLYVIDAQYTLVGTTGVITIRSLNNGLDYLLNVGDTLSPTEPVIGLNNIITIASVVQSPTDAESTEVYRADVIKSRQQQPQGGAKTDYRKWSFDAPGVREVYPYVKQGEPGTVQVYVESDTVDSTDGNGTPSAGMLTNVEQVIEFNPDTTLPTNDRGRRPIQANVEVLPIQTNPVDVMITGLVTSTDDIKNTIQANLVDFLYDVRPYIAGADLPRDKNDVLTAVKMQSVVNDSLVNGNTFLSFTMYVNGVQVNLYTFSLANIPYLRNVTYS